MKKKSPFALDRLSPGDFAVEKKRPVALVLDNIRSGHNVGAAFRLSDAFLLEQVYLCGVTPRPPHPQIAKTGLGAELTVPWHYAGDTVALLKDLKRRGYCILAVELADPAIPLQKLREAVSSGPYALVFGHEVFGVSDEVLAVVDVCVEIPQYGTKFSMNVAMCMGMVVWELLKDWPGGC